MYAKNAASPERIAIGPVVLIADGTVQTSGVSVKVMPQGGAASAGGGTVAYEEGIVLYTPTQAETNYTSFMLIAYKASCIPAATTVITTASATVGTVLLAPTTHTSAVVPTVTTLTGHTAQTGDAFARLGAPAGASVSVDVAAIKTQTAAIEVDTADIQSRLPAALVGGRIDASVGAMAANVMTAAAAAADLTTELQSGLATAANLATVATYIDTEISDIQSRLPAALVGGRMDASVGAMAANVLTASALATDAVDEIVDAVWDEVLSGHAGVGSTGAALSAAGGSGDPWATALPGAYGAGTAGKIIGDNINATISSRGSASDLATVAGYLDTEIAAIKAKTDNLPAAPAATGDCITAAGVRTAVGLASANLDTQLDALPTNAELATALGTADDATLAAVAAVKADTAAILLDTGTDGVVVADKTGFRLSSTGVNDVLRTALTEGYAADGTAFTLEQAVYMLWALLAERGLSGATLTAKKLDGTTAAMTFTLDDATTPTSQTRAT